MDAAQKLLKITALFLVIGMLMAVPGWAAVPTLVPPSSVSIGSSGFNNANVNSSDGTTVIGFTTAISYTSGDPSWLSITGGGSTPATLTLTVSTAGGLSGGSHTATVTFHPNNGTADATMSVTFTGSGGGGGGNGSLTATPNPLSISVGAGGSGTGQVAISSTTAQTLTGVSVSQTTGNNTTWLSASIINPAVALGSNGRVDVTANAFNLVSGVTYTGAVTVSSGSGSVVINVSFVVGSGGSGGGGWVSPSTISWSYTTGGSNFPFQDVAVTPSSGAPTYSVATASSNGWLIASTNGYGLGPIPAGTTFRLGLTSNANALSSGQTTGTATVTDSLGYSITVNVTLTVNGGTSVGGFTITPNPVNFTSAVNGAEQDLTVTMKSDAGGAATVGPGTVPTWLKAGAPSVSNPGPGVGTSFTVQVFPAGLATGNYTASFPVAIGTQTGTVTVNLAVGSGGTGTTGVAPTSLAFAWQTGTSTSSVSKQKLVITGPAGAWSATTAVTTPSGGTWLSVSPNSGTSLPDPTIDGQAPLVSVNPTGLAAGSYTGSIAVTTPGGGSQTIQVALTVSATGILYATSPGGDLIFSATTGQINPPGQNIYFDVSDSSLKPLTLSVAPSNTWITATVSTANAVTVNVDQTGLSTGVYSGTVTVTQFNAANSPLPVPVILVVNGGGTGGTTGTFSFSPGSISFSSVAGSQPAATNLYINSTSGAATTFIGAIRYANGSNPVNWLTVNQAQGSFSGTTPINLSVVAVPTGLAAGTYNGYLDVSGGTGQAAQTVNVTLTVSNVAGTGNVTVTPTSLNFTAQAGASPANQTLSVTSAAGSSGVPFTVTPTTTSGGSWLSTSVNNGTTPLNPLTVVVNSSALAAGSYVGNIQISPTGGTVVNVPVNLTIAAPPGVSATPANLTFTYRLGDNAPAVQSLSVVGGSSTPLAFTATATSTGSWLVASPVTGTTPGTVNVSINTANLNATGDLTGTVLIAGAAGASGATTVSVKITVSAPLPTVTGVTNAGSYASGSISPGEIITIFAPKDGSHPIGPATPAYLTLDSNGKVATSLGGVQVLINGTPSPITFASALQVNAVVPYEVKGFLNANVFVKFLGQSSNSINVSVTATLPGLFTANSSGTGPGAILNSNLTTNTASNPAARGDVAVIYLTGEGETSPGGVTGKVTTVASAPPLTPAPLLPVSVTVGGQPAQWTFAGEAPSLVSGVMQLNVVIPTNIAAGDQLIVVTIGGNPSQQGVTVSVK
jgi:uncharacterized protein (TIGR03437 family)